jgi:hypothetical protein
MSRFLLALSFLVALSGCEGAGGGGAGDAAGSASSSSENLPVYSKSEFVADSTALNEQEDSLAKLGLKFKMGFNYQNGISTRSCEWDKGFLSSFQESNATPSDANWIDALEKYVAAVESHVSKYGSGFNLKGDDGSVSAKKLTDGVKDDFKLKLEVVRKTITALKSAS